MAVTSFCPALACCAPLALPDSIVIATTMAANKTERMNAFSANLIVDPFLLTPILVSGWNIQVRRIDDDSSPVTLPGKDDAKA
jgi:hypothetical protein